MSIWVNENGTAARKDAAVVQEGGASSLTDLDDVSIDTQTLANGQVLKYNSTSGEWENGEGGTVNAMLTDGSNAANNVKFKNVEIDSGFSTYTYSNFVYSITKDAGSHKLVTFTAPGWNSYLESMLSARCNRRGTVKINLTSDTTNRVLVSVYSMVSSGNCSFTGYLVEDITDEINDPANYRYIDFYKVTVGYSLNNGTSGSCAYGGNSHVEGSGCIASGNYSHAEGTCSIASGKNSHAEGSYTNATYNDTHAEGNNTTASKSSSHAEGFYTIASGNYSHAEGQGSSSTGNASHAEGTYTTASGNYSHAEGTRNTAQYDSQHVSGKYNDNKSDTYLEVGNGTADNARSNAFEVTTDGFIRTHNNSTKIAFGVDANGNYGYIKPGADTVYPFNSPTKVFEYNISLSTDSYIIDLGDVSSTRAKFISCIVCKDASSDSSKLNVTPITNPVNGSEIEGSQCGSVYFSAPESGSNYAASYVFNVYNDTAGILSGNSGSYNGAISNVNYINSFTIFRSNLAIMDLSYTYNSSTNSMTLTRRTSGNYPETHTIPVHILISFY